MEEVAKHPWLFERPKGDGTRRFYLRARVPKDIVDALGKTEIKKSLGTTDRREAIGRLKAEAALVQETFDTVRRRLRAAPLSKSC